jgi:hypothetical protein
MKLRVHWREDARALRWLFLAAGSIEIVVVAVRAVRGV